MRFIYLLLMLVPLQIRGQMSLTELCNSCRAEDKLSTEMLGFLRLDYQQSHLLIDLHDLRKEKREDAIAFYCVPGSERKIMQVMASKRTFLTQNDSLLEISGEECNLYKLKYDMPERWLSFPMDASCQLKGNFSSTGHYCHRIALRKFGNYHTCWTGVDKLLLENGDTLKDLSRLQTKRDFAIQTFPIDTLSKSLPAYTTDSVILHLASASQRFEELVVRWYAKGYRYPVLETYALYKKNANGKELDRMHGLDTYDYGARMYDAKLCQWNRGDDKSEKFPNISNYAYCDSNPINKLDPDGNEKIDLLDNKKNNYGLKLDIYNFVDEENVINIWSHGSKNGLEYNNIMDAKSFEKMLNEKSSVWRNRSSKKNTIIILHSCQTSDFAKKVSSSGIFKDVLIVAP